MNESEARFRPHPCQETAKILHFIAEIALASQRKMIITSSVPHQILPEDEIQDQNRCSLREIEKTEGVRFADVGVLLSELLHGAS